MLQMQAIYDAILLIPHSPIKATRLLDRMANEKLNFLEMLKTMAVQLYDRFQPKDSKSQMQYEQMSKTILTLLNSYIRTFFSQKAQNVYLYIQELYGWVVTILTCKNIALTIKKILVPSLTLIIDSLCFKTEKFTSLLDWVSANYIQSASCMFVYVQALLKSKVEEGVKMQTIQHSYAYLYQIAQFYLKQTIEFYKYHLMQSDCGESAQSNIFTTILKGKQYIINEICELITFIYNLSVRKGHKYNNDALLSNILFSPKLAEVMVLILQIQQQMFDSQNKNRFDLNIIIANNLRRSEKKIINNTKSLCLNMLKLILSISDKQFNLFHTDKILMSSLFELSKTIARELCICSREQVINDLGQEVSLNQIICSLYQVWAEIVLFKDIHPTLLELDVQHLIRISFGFMKTRQQEIKLFQQEVQQYFTLVYYILYGCMDEDQEQIDLSITQLSPKKSVVVLIKNLITAANGYHSIMLEVCCDYIWLEMQQRNNPEKQLTLKFLSKYHLPEQVLECLSLEACLFVFTVLLGKHCDQDLYKKKLRFLLQTINLNYLSDLQLCRVYVCLSVNATQFSDNDIQCSYFNFVQKVFKLKCVMNSVCKHGFNFLDRLVNCNTEYNHHYSVFIDKILNLAIDRFIMAKSPYLFQFVYSAMNNQQVRENVVSLGWVNLCLLELSNKLMLQFQGKHIDYEVVTVAVKLYAKVVQIGMERKVFFEKQPYESLQSELAQFEKNVNNFLTVQLFSCFQKIASVKQHIQEQLWLIQQFNEFLFRLLAMDVKLTPQSNYLISNYSIFVLSRIEDLGDYFDYNNSIFKLLYQVINKLPFQLSSQSYIAITNWMKSSLSRDGTNEQIHLNRVCIILQLVYFYLSGNQVDAQNYLGFFSNIAHSIQSTFVKYLIDYQDFIDLIERQPDPDRRRINIGNINLHPLHQQKKRNPITIIRLYNTILLSPTFDPKRIYLVKDIMKHYTTHTIPVYDLSVQIIALNMITKKSKNSGVVQCFRFGLEVLYYNSNHPQSSSKNDTNTENILKTLTQPLRSAISSKDPYTQFSLLMNELIVENSKETPMMDYSKRLQDVEVDIIEFIKSDAYTRELVHKLSAIRRVNNTPRIIRKIKRAQQDQF